MVPGFFMSRMRVTTYSTLPVELQLLPMPRQVHAGQGDYSGRHGHHWRLLAPEILAKSLGNRIKSAALFLRHCLDALDQLLFVFWCHALIPPLSNAAFLFELRDLMRSAPAPVAHFFDLFPA